VLKNCGAAHRASHLGLLATFFQQPLGARFAIFQQLIQVLPDDVLRKLRDHLPDNFLDHLARSFG
jgi:hypothetical protein